ncbi:MAG: hypothetical protein ACOZAL_00150 [Patescibacteria group bacterium]
MKRFKKINKWGFTLIELVIYVSIFIILIISITLFALTFIEANTKSKIKKDISSAAYSIIKSISYEVKRADDIYVPTSIFNSPLGQLSLMTSQQIPSGEKIGYIDFYLDNGKVYLKREGQNPQILISENFKVTKLEFDHLPSSPDSVRINLTIEYDTSAPKYRFSYSLNSLANIRK